MTIPSTATAPKLSFWLAVDSSETTSSTVYDWLQVQIVGSTTTTLATYSNLTRMAYTQKSFDLSAFKGQTVTVKFVGTEDSSLLTTTS